MPLWLAMLHFVKPAMDSPISRHQVKQHHLTAIPCVSTTLAFKHKYALQQRTIQIKHSAYLLEWILQPYWKIRREILRRCSVTIYSFFSLGFSQTKCILTELLVVNHKYNIGNTIYLRFKPKLLELVINRGWNDSKNQAAQMKSPFIHANVPLSKPMDTEAYTWINSVQVITHNCW